MGFHPNEFFEKDEKLSFVNRTNYDVWQKKERKLAHCLELRIVGSMKKILLIYSDSLVLNIPRAGNISTTRPGYLYLTVLENEVPGSPAVFENAIFKN